LPLLLLLSFWIVFFDKARTIARITGFSRVVERDCYNQFIERIVGWENAMKGYWKYKKDWDSNQNRLNIIDANIENNANKKLRKSTYWFTIYVVFFLISCLCFLLYFLNSGLKLKPVSEFSLLSSIVLIFILACPYLFTFFLLSRYWSKSDNPLNNLSQYFTEDLGWFCWLDIILCGFGIFWSAYIFNYCFLSADYLWTWEFLVLWGFLFLFQYISLMEYWIFFNLIKGRYSYSAFENRWELILPKVELYIMKDP
jgi:hypothetical protein